MKGGKSSIIIMLPHWVEVGIYERKVLREKVRKHAFGQEKKRRKKEKTFLTKKKGKIPEKERKHANCQEKEQETTISTTLSTKKKI